METFDGDRRRLLAALSAAGLAGAGCTTIAPLCPRHPSISNDATPLTIDTHSHVFNGSDLQVKEFLLQTTDPARAAKRSEFAGLVARLGTSLLQQLAWDLAPSATEERRALARYADAIRTCSPPEAIATASADAFQDGYARGSSELKRVERTLREDPGSRKVLGPNEAGPGLGAAIQDLPETYIEFRRRRATPASVLGAQPHIAGYLNFVLHHFNHRHVNALDYLTTYASDSRKVDLVVANLVDYDWWLARGRPTATTLAEQVELMGQISVVTGGRVHAFVPFCPMRETMTSTSGGPGQSFRLVEEAIASHGCIGVKLYPPMGFAPYGNARLDVWKNRPTLVAAASASDFGARLDAAMKRLFEWCVDNEVPVMAHANESNAPYADFAKLAGSGYWEQALHAFPGLRVSFGHFGDTEMEDHGSADSVGYLALMSDTVPQGRNVYADSGYFGGALSNPVALSRVLSDLYQRNGAVDLRKRLMFGTDWTMILPLQRVEDYVAELEGVIARVNPQVATLNRDFFGDNAVRFLGLAGSQKTRLRLEKFYGRHQVETPDWMRKVG